MMYACGNLSDWVEQGVLSKNPTLLKELNATFGRARNTGGTDSTLTEHRVRSMKDGVWLSFASSALMCQFASLQPAYQVLFEQAIWDLFEKHPTVGCIALEMDKGKTKMVRLDIVKHEGGLLFKVPGTTVKWSPAYRKREKAAQK